jgi:hypothetical protein
MNESEVAQFEKVEAQLMGFLEEFQSLTRKSPDHGVNKFKLKHVNVVLAAANKLMKPAQRPFADFQQFDDVDVPTNSDVLLILRQYANLLEEARAANITRYSGYWYWLIKGQRSERRARPPAKLKD